MEPSGSDRVREARWRLGMTQGELAELLDVSVRAVQYWESGKRAPSRLVFRALEWAAERRA